MGRKAVAGDDIEADAGQQRHAPRLRLSVPRRERLEDVDFPGDVEIVNAIAEAGVGKRPRGRRERAGDTERCANAVEPRIKASRVGEVERPGGEAKRSGDGLDPLEVASRQDRARPPVHRGPRDQPAGVAGRPVDQDSSAHVNEPRGIDDAECGLVRLIRHTWAGNRPLPGGGRALRRMRAERHHFLDRRTIASYCSLYQNYNARCPIAPNPPCRPRPRLRRERDDRSV